MAPNMIDELQLAKVDWEPWNDFPYLFVAYHDGKTVYLRLNEFPAEPLCTVILDGVESDVDDLPKSWTLPRHRQKGP